MGIKDPIRRAYVEDGHGNFLWQTVNVDTHLVGVMRGQEYLVDELWAGVANGEVVTLGIKTPENKIIRLDADVVTSLEIEVAFFESSVISGGLTSAIFNRNRRKPDESTVFVYNQPSVTIQGTELFRSLIGSDGGKFSASGGDFSDWIILNKNETYILQITSLAASNRISAALKFLELDESSQFI